MEFDEFLRHACPPLDLQWRKYRRRAARRSIRRRMEELGLGDYRSYLSLLEADGEEAAALADRMNVTVSRFFRERGCWEKLSTEILAPALTALPPDVPFRAWSAGCCGGEEPFTLVMLWKILAENCPHGRRLEVTATDIDGPSLDRAAGGTYSSGSLREIPAALKERWFERHGGDLWKLDGAIAGSVEFRGSNLAAGNGPQGADLVLCRYLAFTYYRGRRRLEAARTLHAALREGGILFIGRKEGLGPGEREIFIPVDAGCGIYRKRGR